MESISIMFKSAADVSEFVNSISVIDYDIDIKHGSIELDAKSLTGLYALPLNTKLVCSIHEDSIDKLKELAGKFMVQ